MRSVSISGGDAAFQEKRPRLNRQPSAPLRRAVLSLTKRLQPAKLAEHAHINSAIAVDRSVALPEGSGERKARASATAIESSMNASKNERQP